MGKLRSIQVLRAVAALAVVALHSTTSVFRNGAGTFYWGAAGVDLFFVISGFIIGTIASGQEPLSFLKRRAWRIYPMWFVAAAAYAAIVRPSFTPARLAATLTLWPVWGHFRLPLPSVGWTLAFEMLFYVATALALRTKPWVPLAMFAAAMIFNRTLGSSVLHFLGNPIIFEFLMGVAISRLPRRATLALPGILLGIFLFALSPPWLFDRAIIFHAGTSTARVVFWGIPAALIVYGALGIERSFASRSWNIPVFLGDASYSIYLFHLGVTEMFPGPWWGKAAIATITGCGTYWLVERHVVRRGLPTLAVLFSSKRSGAHDLQTRDSPTG